MTCSDEELEARRQQARELGMHHSVDLAWFPGEYSHACIRLHTLVTYVGVDTYGPFATVEEAVNMLILLGGGPK